MASIQKDNNKHGKDYKNDYKVVKAVIRKKRRHSSLAITTTATNTTTTNNEILRREKTGKVGVIMGHKNDEYPAIHEERKNCSCKQVFDGMVLAVSNFNSSPDNEEARGVKSIDSDEQYSYKGMAQQLRAAGATVSSQVHKRIHALIASNVKSYTYPENDIDNITAMSTTPLFTQRIRKALKLNIPIADVSWVENSMKEGRILDMKPYLFNNGKAATMGTNITAIRDKAYKNEPENSQQDSTKKDKSVGSTNTNNKYNNYVSLGCCCACHDSENAVYNCPWCESCR
jgi:hypothetical protein